MSFYNAPIKDMHFVYNELFEGSKLTEFPDYSEFTPDVVDTLLEEANKLASNVLQPINLSGDSEGCKIENGIVRTPKGFKEAYEIFIQNGWTGLSGSPKYGGQGSPAALYFLLQEMICSTNMAFGTYPGLTDGAYNAINLHGSEHQKDFYLPKFVTGKWTGTMCLTESQCGTDLGLIRTKAKKKEDGSYLINGTKIFITGGDHDLSENIIHLVLARSENSPKGIKGISMFLVPKYLPKEDGTIGKKNNVTCNSIEKKMGIKGSATCVMNFDNAQGWLVGDINGGMKAMFTMMNTARLGVGIQGIGVSEAAYQKALEYARERLQGRSLLGEKSPEKPADSILEHPDVRKNLLTIKALTEGLRALAIWTAINLDISDKSKDYQEKQRADDFCQLLTPIVKSFSTDKGFLCTNLGLQVFGGHGYIHEHGMEQLVRDARITQLYEGTNGIQAMDLVGRKMGAHYGRLLRSFFHPVQEFIEKNINEQELKNYIPDLAKALGLLQQASATIAQRGLKNPDEAGATATEYLNLFGHVALAFIWAKTAKIAIKNKENDPTGFYSSKITTAKFYYKKILPETMGLFSMIMAGSESIMKIDKKLFN